MKMKLAFALCLTATLAGADELSGPGRKTLIQEDWGTIFCQDTCVVKRDASGNHYRLETDKGLAVASRNGDGWVVQAPNQNIRVLRRQLADGSEQMWVQFNGNRYAFERQPQQYTWMFPTGKTFFTLFGGEVRSGLGKDGTWKLHKHPGGAAYQIQGETGDTEVVLGKRKKKGADADYVLIQQSGEDLSKHPHLVRGVVFDNGPIGIYVRMPKTPVLQALDWTQVETVTSTVPFPEPKLPPVVDRRDPLQAVEAARNEDPLRMKRKPFEKDRSMFDPSVTLPPPATEGTWYTPK
jgi:hypothetical protein